MIWRKLGLVYRPAREYDWAVSHAFVPTPLMIDETTIRLYVAFLDQTKVGRVGFVDVDARDPLKKLRISASPVLDIGDPGTFDDSGVTPMCIVPHEKALYLYYTGWQNGVKVRYYLFTGLAISVDGGYQFTRLSRAPVLDRSDGELFIRTAAHVHAAEECWKIWYV